MLVENVVTDKIYGILSQETRPVQLRKSGKQNGETVKETLFVTHC